MRRRRWINSLVTINHRGEDTELTGDTASITEKDLEKTSTGKDIIEAENHTTTSTVIIAPLAQIPRFKEEER